MVDKAWYDWREKYPNESVSSLSTSMFTFVGYSPQNVNARNYANSKSLGIWYAYNHLLEINDYDFTQDQTFKYSTGNIDVDNVTLSSSTDMEIYIDQGSSYDVKITGPFEAPAGSTLKIDTY